MIYIDTNYWIYWLDERLSEHKCVLKSVRSALKEGVLINYVTLMEIAHYIRHLDEIEFRERMSMIQQLSTLTMMDLNASIIDLALKLLTKHAQVGMGGRDSVILATMQVNNVKRILTHDEAFKRVKGIKVLDVISTNR